ncbi:MAG: 50S ribosomal protein L14e [Candidatus Micrarchaeota archaeon]
MATFEKGRVCIKNLGRENGAKCVVVNVLDDNFVEVVCAGRKKRRKCNRRHLEPTDEMLNFGTDEEAAKALA